MSYMKTILFEKKHVAKSGSIFRSKKKFNYCTLIQIWTFSKALFENCKKLFIQIICQVKLHFALEIFSHFYKEIDQKI